MVTINGPTRSAIHAFYVVTNYTEAPYQHGTYTRLVAEQLALQNRHTEPAQNPVFDLIVEQELAVRIADHMNLSLSDLRQQLETQRQNGSPVTCLIVMCFDESQQLFRIDLPASLPQRHDESNEGRLVPAACLG